MIHKRARLARAFPLIPNRKKSVITQLLLTWYRTVSFQASWKCLVFFFFLLWITINYFILRVVLSLKYIPISRSFSLPSWRFLIFAWILNFNLSNVKINISSLSHVRCAFLFIDRLSSNRFTLYRFFTDGSRLYLVAKKMLFLFPI